MISEQTNSIESRRGPRRVLPPIDPLPYARVGDGLKPCRGRGGERALGTAGDLAQPSRREHQCAEKTVGAAAEGVMLRPLDQVAQRLRLAVIEQHVVRRQHDLMEEL